MRKGYLYHAHACCAILIVTLITTSALLFLSIPRIIILMNLDFCYQVVKSPASVERLTDPSKYTGSSKQRFDDTGKGKGISGRKDLPDASGYVTGYQHKNTYDKTH